MSETASEGPRQIAVQFQQRQPFAQPPGRHARAVEGSALSGLHAALMGMIAASVQWFGSDRTPMRSLRRAFLITLGVPIAAWCGVFLADLALRRRDYDQEALYDANGRYGSIGWVAVGAMVVGTFVGWGLVSGYSDYWLD
jgi:cytosine/uracil/thiamine/allantoin permease